MLKHSAGGVATRRARPIRFVDDPRPLASFHDTLTFHSCAAPHAGPPQSRLAPAPEPLPSCASLRTGKLDSCRFLSTPVDSSPHARGPSRTRPRSHALVAPSRPSAESTGIDGSRQESGMRDEAGRKGPHKSRRLHLCVRRSRLRENSSWVQQEKTTPSTRSVKTAQREHTAGSL